MRELKPQRGGVVLLGAFLLFAPVRLLLALFSQFSFQHVLKYACPLAYLYVMVCGKDVGVMYAT